GQGAGDFLRQRLQQGVRHRQRVVEGERQDAQALPVVQQRQAQQSLFTQTVQQLPFAVAEAADGGDIAVDGALLQEGVAAAAVVRLERQRAVGQRGREGADRLQRGPIGGGQQQEWLLDAGHEAGHALHRLVQLLAVLWLAQRAARLLQLPNFAQDRKSTRLNSSHVKISYADFCL